MSATIRNRTPISHAIFTTKNQTPFVVGVTRIVLRNSFQGNRSKNRKAVTKSRMPLTIPASSPLTVADFPL